MTVWRRWVFTALIGGLAASAAAGKTAELPPQILPAPQSVPLKIIDTKSFCSSLQHTLEQYGQQAGYDRVQTQILASSGSSILVQELKAGHAADYVDAASLAHMTRLPHITPEHTYLRLAAFLGNAMGVGGGAMLALSPTELRFIPFAQSGMEIIVIAKDAKDLTPARLKKLAEVARNYRISISTVWTGEASQEHAASEAAAFAWLAASTGGRFANLSGDENPCARGQYL